MRISRWLENIKNKTNEAENIITEIEAINSRLDDTEE